MFYQKVTTESKFILIRCQLESLLTCSSTTRLNIDLDTINESMNQ